MHQKLECAGKFVAESIHQYQRAFDGITTPVVIRNGLTSNSEDESFPDGCLTMPAGQAFLDWLDIPMSKLAACGLYQTRITDPFLNSAPGQFELDAIDADRTYVAPDFQIRY